MKILRIIPLILLLIPGIMDAQEPSAIEKLRQQAEQAGQDAAAGTLETHEINNIAKRRTLHGKTGLVSYVVFLSRSGQPIDYFVVNGKCTSSKKRLTPDQELGHGGINSGVVRSAAEDGTHGSSAPYIYCFTTDEKYKQWNGQYYVSDYPIELTIKPIMIDTSGAIQAQQ